MSHKDRWIYSLYAWSCRLHSTPFSLSDALKQPVRLLVCLPSDPDEARHAAGIIPDLVVSLGAEAVFVAGEPGSLAYCDAADETISMVPLDQAARRWPGLPSARILDRLSMEKLSLAIDLNPRPELLSAVLCLKTGAPVRLCLQGPHRERFFNVQVLLAGDHGAGGEEADPIAGGEADDPPIQPDPAQSEPALSGTSPSSGNSPYARLLRVVQTSVRPASRPELQLDSLPRSRDIQR